MRIKFGQMWGNSLGSSHFEKKARKITDLVGSVNYNSRQDRHSEQAPPATSPGPPNQVVFVAFDTRKMAGKRCARLVHCPSQQRASDTSEGGKVTHITQRVRTLTLAPLTES